MSGRRRVVLSSTIDPTYSFFAPLTALVWKRMAGFEPLLLLVGSEQEWRKDRRTELVLTEAARHAEGVFVSPPPGAAAHTGARGGRLWAGALEGADAACLMVSD